MSDDKLEAKDTTTPPKAATYVTTGPAPLGGQLTTVDTLAANAAFTPPVDPAQAMKSPGGPQAPSPINPGETTGAGSGQMVTESPSQSGTGSMYPGAGVRGVDAGS
jgi:hypothetical protein